MKATHLLRIWVGLALAALTGCAPQALYFHESTKMSFSADYTSSDSQPLSTSFGYKRRIVAVVPAKERFSPTGERRDAENEDEALSTISKFYVKAGTKEGLVIRNNFATGMAARRLMKEPTSAAVAVAGLMHNTPVVTDSDGTVLGAAGEPLTSRSGAPLTVSDVAASRVARIKSKMIGGGGSAVRENPEVRREATGTISIVDGVTMITVRQADSSVVKVPYKKYLEDKKKARESAQPKPDAEPSPPREDTPAAAPSGELFVDPATGRTMRRIRKADGSFDVVPLKR